MRQVRSTGVIVLRDAPYPSFLLMKHPHRWDLPKGHVDPGETDLEAALRELKEETGLKKKHVEIDPDFRFEMRYQVHEKRLDNELCEKTLVIFLGWLRKEDAKIKCTEHEGFEWFPWQPPHAIQPKTIDPVLAAVEGFLRGRWPVRSGTTPAT